MLVYRLVRKKYNIELSGKGASFSGNRWNSKGTEIIYCSESRALAMAEIAVHLTLISLPSDYFMLEIEIPKSIKIKDTKTKDLPIGWNKFPHLSRTQIIGDGFVRENKFCVMKVPSVVVAGDFNFLINPFHNQFRSIKIKSKSSFPFDNRLFKH